MTTEVKKKIQIASEYLGGVLIQPKQYNLFKC